MIILLGIRGLIFTVVFMGSCLRWMIFYYPYVIILPFTIKLMTLFIIGLGAWFGFEISKFNLRYSNFFLKGYNYSWFFSSI